jgi:hypothetical protein
VNLVAVIRQLLWIVGLSLIIASFSWRAWQMRITRIRVSLISDNRILDLGLFLFCLGITLSTKQLWASNFFFLMMISVTIIALVNWISSMRKAR